MPKPLSCILLFLWPTARLPAQIAVQLDRMNVLYNATENPLTIAAGDVPDDHLLLIPSMGEITKRDTGHYVWRICGRDQAEVSLVIRDTVAGIDLDTFRYRVKQPPEPIPTIKSHTGEVQRGIAMVVETFDFEVPVEVVHYEALFIPKKSDPYSYVNYGARFNGDVMEAMQKVYPGYIIIFSKFAYRIGCDSMVYHSSQQLTFTIK